MCWLINKEFRATRNNVAPVRGRLTMHAARLCFSALLLLSMCTSRNPSGRGLFAMDSLLNVQASHLATAQASLTKEIVLGTTREEITLVPKDTIAWLKELEVFAIVDAINKPTNRDRYVVTEEADQKSNLRVKSFTAKDDLPVAYVRLFYHDVPARIRKVEASYHEVNGLYKTTRLLSLGFEDIDGVPVLTSYSIAGGQKMVMDDTVQYDIKGNVRLP